MAFLDFIDKHRASVRQQSVANGQHHKEKALQKPTPSTSKLAPAGAGEIKLARAMRYVDTTTRVRPPVMPEFRWPRHQASWETAKQKIAAQEKGNVLSQEAGKESKQPKATLPRARSWDR